jgi:hypothetical protein
VLWEKEEAQIHYCHLCFDVNYIWGCDPSLLCVGGYRKTKVTEFVTSDPNCSLIWKCFMKIGIKTDHECLIWLDNIEFPSNESQKDVQTKWEKAWRKERGGDASDVGIRKGLFSCSLHGQYDHVSVIVGLTLIPFSGLFYCLFYVFMEPKRTRTRRGFRPSHAWANQELGKKIPREKLNPDVESQLIKNEEDEPFLEESD